MPNILFVHHDKESILDAQTMNIQKKYTHREATGGQATGQDRLTQPCHKNTVIHPRPMNFAFRGLSPGAPVARKKSSDLRVSFRPALFLSGVHPRPLASPVLL